jgi:diaminohydroxyphosphoribosylaminopyrimidine deaminase / 5-amino-6-(5-phosphoribosylamino)uracil reductase
VNGETSDLKAMAQAVALGERGRESSAPNPWVGCVVVRDGQVVGEGFHRRAGEPHAEAHALAQAGERARGATAYVTLEPCAHHGRTPPCVDALLRAGIQRVVVGVLDPDRHVSGRGVADLRSAGVVVDVGVGADVAGESLAPYLHQRRTGCAYAVLKAAISLDGRTAAADGSSQWISSPESRADAHGLRARSQAIMVGSGTALADLPRLTVRDACRAVTQQPLRVVLDARGRVPATGPLFDLSLAPTLVLTSEAVDRAALRAWCATGVDVEVLPPAADGLGVDLASALHSLGRRGVLQVLVEGGARLHAALARAGLIGRLVLYVAPATLGAEGRPLLAGPGARSIAEADRWRLLDVRRLGEGDVRLEYAPAPRAQEEEEVI